MSIFGRKTELVDATILADQVSLAGMELENTVRAMLSLSASWELVEIQPLFLALNEQFVVGLSSSPHGFECRITPRSGSATIVVEGSDQSPAVALARAAVAAVQTWGSF